MLRLGNWSGTLSTTPARVARPGTLEELQAIVRDRNAWPSPVRAFGSTHSTTPCLAADGGTLVNLQRLDRVLEIGTTTVRVQAGISFFALNRALAERDLEFRMNLQIGNATVGSLVCCASKDGAYPGGFGQVASYCSAMTLVTPSGELETIDESDPERLRLARSSYGLLGIVVEATLAIRRRRKIAVEHRRMRVAEFCRQLPALTAGSASIAYYLFPFIDRVIVQIRTPVATDRRPNRIVWRLRNFGAGHIIPAVSRAIAHVPGRALRAALAAGFYGLAAWTLATFVRAPSTWGTDQTMRYRHPGGMSRLTFSIWGFPARGFGTVLEDYVRFVRNYYRETGYRSYMLTVGYHVTRDDRALLSYSPDGDVVSIDPTSTGQPGWEDFVRAFNAFALERGARPLLNQSPALTADQVHRAFGARVEAFAAARRRADPDGRFLNPFFAELLRE